MDRNGHGCMLQYAILHLFGYKLSMDDLKAFRVSALALIRDMVELYLMVMAVEAY